MKIIDRICSINKLFSKSVVTFCILFMTYLFIRAFNLLEYRGIDSTKILSAAIAFFGGELVVLIAKSIYGNRNDTRVQVEEIKTFTQCNDINRFDGKP